jgi:hypothetical protein
MHGSIPMLPTDDSIEIPNQKKEKHNAPAGIITARAGKKLRHAIQWMLLCSKVKTVYSLKTKKSYSYRLAFITLTLSESQKHTDEEVKQLMLRPLLKWVERQGCKLWVWKAETQKNGRLHFHITVDGFIHWKSLRKKWNQIQYKHGYKKAFEGKDGANSTDIHAVRNARKIGSYIEKYICKTQDDRRLVDGRLWGCSMALSRMKYRTDDSDIMMWISERSTYKQADYCRIYIHDQKVFHHPSLKLFVDSIKDLACQQTKFSMS